MATKYSNANQQLNSEIIISIRQLIIRTYKLKLKIQISEIHFDILLLAIVFQFFKKRKKYNLNLKYTINEKQNNIKLYILKNTESIIEIKPPLTLPISIYLTG